MGLNILQLAKSLTGLGFSLGSDLTVQATYRQIKNAGADSGYSPITGAVSPQFTDIAVTAMILKYGQKQTDGHMVRIGDERVLIQASQLATITPASDDVLIVGSITRNLLNFTLDPAKAMFTFQARRPVAA